MELLCAEFYSSSELFQRLYQRTKVIMAGFGAFSAIWLANLPVKPLGREDPLEKGMTTHSSTLAWRIPRTEEPGGLQLMGLQRVRHNWATNTLTFFFQLSDTGGVLVWSVSSAPEPFTSTRGLPKSSLSVSTTLGTLIVCVCVCVYTYKHTDTHTRTRTASLNNYIILFTLPVLWIWKSIWVQNSSKTHVQWRYDKLTFSLHLLWSVGHFGFSWYFLMISQLLNLCFNSSWASHSLKTKWTRRWPRHSCGSPTPSL